MSEMSHKKIKTGRKITNYGKDLNQNIKKYMYSPTVYKTDHNQVRFFMESQVALAPENKSL